MDAVPGAHCTFPRPNETVDKDDIFLATSVSGLVEFNHVSFYPALRSVHGHIPVIPDALFDPPKQAMVMFITTAPALDDNNGQRKATVYLYDLFQMPYFTKPVCVPGLASSGGVLQALKTCLQMTTDSQTDWRIECNILGGVDRRSQQPSEKSRDT
ncbi:hypothetical protein K432DRAFT_388411 [Lepidopterella palustris CBS 459.81]|uniref:Uncharacterized protein n=1 Tax=Lepidopterella palustris CBS 459.81 TaxID=1314670 RepID=A0A8E2JKC4_9PEZI|nr:hypothetical protein K432DRAFT_388411 [Lepidopterella palustris CBS 459.81]